jgi:hypothetical protein
MGWCGTTGLRAARCTERNATRRTPAVTAASTPGLMTPPASLTNGYSAHADRMKLADWLGSVRAASPALGRVYLVYGERGAQDAFAGDLAARGYDVTCGEPDMVVSW